MQGIVKFFNENRGFGFITGEDGQEYFVHCSEVKDSIILCDNDAVVFDTEQGDRGLKAIKVVLK